MSKTVIKIIACPACGSKDVEQAKKLVGDTKIPSNVFGCWQCGKEFKIKQ